VKSEQAKCYKTKKAALISHGFKSFVSAKQGRNKVTEQKGRADNNARIFSLAAVILPLFYFHQVNGERPRGAVQRPNFRKPLIS
jgi:hypothetical protein